MAKPTIHPGEHVRIDIDAAGESVESLSFATGLPVSTVDSLIAGEIPVTDDIAVALAQWQGTTPDYWLNLQKMYDARLQGESAGEMAIAAIEEYEAGNTINLRDFAEREGIDLDDE